MMDSEENKAVEQASDEAASSGPPAEGPAAGKPEEKSGGPEQAKAENSDSRPILLMERMPAKPAEKPDEPPSGPKRDDNEPSQEPGGDEDDDEDGLHGRSVEDIDRARNRQKAFLQKRRRQKKLRVLYGRLRILIKLCFAVVLCFAIWEFAMADLWVFDGEQVRLPELRMLDSGEVQPVLAAYTGEPVYNVDPRQIETIVKSKYPIVSDLYVRRSLFPARLDLTIMEKQPWGELYRKFGDERPYAVVGADYRPVLLRPYTRAKSAFPDEKLVKLMLPPGKVITPEYLKKLDRLTYQLDSVRGLRLSFIDARNPQSIEAYFDHVRVRLGRLDATTPERLARLAPLVPEINRLRGEIDQVDLRWLNQVAFHRGEPDLPVLGEKPKPSSKEKPDAAETVASSDPAEPAPAKPVSSVQGD